MLDEQVLTMAEAAKAVPQGRKRKSPHVATVWRWATRGVRGVVLETVLIGGQRFTTESSLEKFFREINQGSRIGRPLCRESERRSLSRACEAEGI